MINLVGSLIIALVGWKFFPETINSYFAGVFISIIIFGICDVINLLMKKDK